jgi:hypothetical protein
VRRRPGGVRVEDINEGVVEDVFELVHQAEALPPSVLGAVEDDESHAKISLAWARRNSAPSGARAPGGRIDSGALEDCPDRGGTDLTAHAGKFSGDASVAPVRVLAGETQNQPVQRR